MNKIKKMTFLGFVGPERFQSFAGICIYGIGVSLSTFVMVTPLLTLLQMIFFTLTNRTFPISNGENCNVNDSLCLVARP